MFGNENQDNKSNSWKQSNESLKNLIKAKNRLGTILEELKSLKHKMTHKYKNDAAWTKKIEELEKACVNLEGFLEELRMHQANDLPEDSRMECPELAKTLATANEMAAVHEKGSKTMAKNYKALLE